MNDNSKYKKLFENKGIKITDSEIDKIIENIDNIGNLLFKKYKQKLENNINSYE